MKKLLSVIALTISFNAFSQVSKWKILYVWQGYQMENIKAKKGEVQIAIADKSISGNIGCNKFQGKLEYTKGDHIKLLKVTNTKEKCPKEADPAEKAVLDALNGANKLVINQDKAKLYKGEKLVMEMNR